MLIKTFISIFVSLAVALIGFWIIFFIACFVLPPRDAYGHVNMALGQTFLALIISIALGVWALYFLLKRYARLLPFKEKQVNKQLRFM